ncbi:transposase [Salinibacter ruber]
MAGIAYRRRALPICWETYRREGVTNAGQQISLLRALAGLFPEDTEVVVVGDGAFHSTDLMEFIEDQGWHFCLRLHTDTYVRASAEGPWKQLRELVPEEGERRYLQKVLAGERQRVRSSQSRPLPRRGRGRSVADLH